LPIWGFSRAINAERSSRFPVVPVRIDEDIQLPVCRSGVSYCESSSSSVASVDKGSVDGDSNGGGGG
jgi:hypothetical protein